MMQNRNYWGEKTIFFKQYITDCTHLHQLATVIRTHIYHSFMISNHKAATQCKKSCRQKSSASLLIHIKHRTKKNGDLIDHSMTVGGLSILETVGLLGFSRTTASTHKSSSEGSNAQLIRKVREEWPNLFKLTGMLQECNLHAKKSLYNHAEQKSISKHTIRFRHCADVLQLQKSTFLAVKRQLWPQAHQNLKKKITHGVNE